MRVGLYVVMPFAGHLNGFESCNVGCAAQITWPRLQRSINLRIMQHAKMKVTVKPPTCTPQHTSAAMR